MYQLTYISTARPEVRRAGAEAILASSRRNNAAAGITGLLLFDGVRFLQALEGDRAALKTTYARIKEDPRHRAVVLLSSREIAAREFGEWSMGWSRSSAAAPVTADLAEIVDTLVANVPDPDTRALFGSFARLKRDAA